MGIGVDTSNAVITAMRDALGNLRSPEAGVLEAELGRRQLLRQNAAWGPSLWIDSVVRTRFEDLDTGDYYYEDVGTTQEYLMTFDVCTSESHKEVATVTSYPVETGSTISDHVIKKPVAIDITVLVTNTPIQVSALYAAREANNNRRCLDTYENLIDLMNTKNIVHLDTGLRRYENLIITSVTVPRSPKNSRNAIEMSISFKEILMVSSRVDWVDPQILEETIRDCALHPSAHNAGDVTESTDTPPDPAVADSFLYRAVGEEALPDLDCKDPYYADVPFAISGCTP